MLAFVLNAELQALNVISLSDLLVRSGREFRNAVIANLIQEGFELEDQVPCLHHPSEILEAVSRMECRGVGTTWDEFREALTRAGRTGILLDLASLAASPGRRVWKRIRTVPRPRE